MLAGYFVRGAYDSKGTARFLRDRAVRLGIPSAFFMFVIHPVTVYSLLPTFQDHSIPPLSKPYWPYIASGKACGGYCRRSDDVGPTLLQEFTQDGAMTVAFVHAVATE